MVKRFLTWFLKWQWAMLFVLVVSMMELITGNIMPLFRAISNWLIVLVGSFLLMGYLSSIALKD